MEAVNQMWHLGEAFTDKKVVAKIMVSVPQKFAKSCDLQSLTIQNQQASCMRENGFKKR